MDSIPDREFIEMFDRVTDYVDLEGCETREDVEKRMNRIIKIMRRARRKAKKKSTRRKWRTLLKRMYILRREGVPAKSPKLKGKTRMGFPTRVVEHAMLHPRRAISLTLLYGKKKALKILRKRARRRREQIARKYARR